MNKEKTALTQLIENIDARLKNDASDTLRYSLETCRNEAKALLQKEKEQIEKAFDDGAMQTEKAVLGENPDFHLDDEGKDYYQSKYGGENE